MKTKRALKYIAAPAKVTMTVLILLITLVILQAIIGETIWMISYTNRASKSKSELKLTQEEERLDRITRSTKEFLPDGTIHLVYKPKRARSNEDGSEPVQIYDVNNNLLWEGPYNQKPYDYLSWASTPRSYSETFTQRQMKQLQMITPEFSDTLLVIPVNSSDRTEQVWQYLPDSRYFVGYNIGGEKMGYTGPTGFTDSKSKVKPFGKFGSFTAWCPRDSYSPTVLWQTQREVYQIDFEKQEIDLIFESIDSDIETISLHAWRDFKPGSKDYIDREKYRPLLLCVTKDDIYHLILREPNQYLSLDIPRSLVTATKNDIFLTHTDSDVKPPFNTGSYELYDKWIQDIRNKTRNFWVELYKIGERGELELLNRFDWSVPPTSDSSWDFRMATQRYITQFSPPFYNLVTRLAGKKLWTYIHDSQNRGDFYCGLFGIILEFRPKNNIINLILSVLMMAFMFFHGWSRRTSIAKFAFWLIFTGLFNLAGLLTYLALNHTPVIICPICGKKRGLGRTDCVRCNNELPSLKPGKLDLIYNT